MKTLTSESDPIRVDFLPQHLTRLRGRIGMTFAPGKKHDGVSATWDRSLAVDLERLVSVYRTDVLVSLVENHELQALAITDLASRAAENGLELRRFPFRDGGVPASLEHADTIVSSVLEVARAGGNVVIHCRGGLGRTGLVAACALVATGHAPSAAFAAVRAARDGTVENDGQKDFIRLFAAGRRGSASSDEAAQTSSPTFSRSCGCLLGGAVGDALGYPIEFEKSARAIFASRGKAAPNDIVHGAGVAKVSDDTQMTLFVAEGVIRGIQRWADRGVSSIEGSVLRALVRWYTTQTGVAVTSEWGDVGWLVRDRRLHSRRAPGVTCMASLAAQLQGSGVPTVERPPNDSKGCGAVMRSAPIGLAAASRQLAFQVARDAGVLTHGHPSGYLSAAYFASVIYDVSRGVELSAAMDHADRALARETGRDEMSRVIAKVRAAVKNGPPSHDAIEAIGGGWTGEEALGIGLLCALTADGSSPDGLADSLWRSVAHGGDSDSTGSIAGNLLGAMYGVEELPPRWLAQVELRDTIERVADDLYAAAVLGTQLDYESYPPN